MGDAPVPDEEQRTPAGEVSYWEVPQYMQPTTRFDGTIVHTTPKARENANTNWPDGTPKWRNSKICIMVNGFEKTISENDYTRWANGLNVGVVRAVYYPRDDRTWEPKAHFFLQFETEYEAWSVARKINGWMVPQGSRTLDCAWSTTEIDMFKVNGSENGKNPQPGMARGCLYGDQEVLCPDRRMMEQPWISESWIDATGQIGHGLDGIRWVYCRDPTCWVYDQEKEDKGKGRDEKGKGKGKGFDGEGKGK
jgi:hypothetical protein